MSSTRITTETQDSPIKLVPQFSINLESTLKDYPVIDMDRVDGVVGINGIMRPIGEGNEHYVMRYLQYPRGDERNNTGDHYVLKIPKTVNEILKHGKHLQNFSKHTHNFVVTLVMQLQKHILWQV